MPRDPNQVADDIIKIMDAGDYMLNPKYFAVLNSRWGPHTSHHVSNLNAQCEIVFRNIGALACQALMCLFFLAKNLIIGLTCHFGLLATQSAT
jgi:hypothetical protein